MNSQLHTENLSGCYHLAVMPWQPEDNVLFVWGRMYVTVRVGVSVDIIRHGQCCGVSSQCKNITVKQEKQTVSFESFGWRIEAVLSISLSLSLLLIHLSSFRLLDLREQNSSSVMTTVCPLGPLSATLWGMPMFPQKEHCLSQWTSKCWQMYFLVEMCNKAQKKWFHTEQISQPQHFQLSS